MAANDNESPEDAVFSDRGRKMALRGAMMAVSAGWAAAFGLNIAPVWTGPMGVPGLIIGLQLLARPANDN